MNVAIDIVSDLVCPWCFIGKARLKGALALVKEKHPDVEFQINWLPYFLNPDTPKASESYRAYTILRGLIYLCAGFSSILILVIIGYVFSKAIPHFHFKNLIEPMSQLNDSLQKERNQRK